MACHLRTQPYGLCCGKAAADSLAHVVGDSARNSRWINALGAYRESPRGAADAASALATVEGLSNYMGYNFSNQMMYAAPARIPSSGEDRSCLLCTGLQQQVVKGALWRSM